MIRRTALLVAATGLIAAAPAPAAPTASAVIDCDLQAGGPNVVISSARNMRCRAAWAEMKRYRGSIARTFSTPGGFRCTRVSGQALGGQWRCTNGSRSFRFDFAD